MSMFSPLLPDLGGGRVPPSSAQGRRLVEELQRLDLGAVVPAPAAGLPGGAVAGGGRSGLAWRSPRCMSVFSHKANDRAAAAAADLFSDSGGSQPLSPVSIGSLGEASPSTSSRDAMQRNFDRLVMGIDSALMSRDQTPTTTVLYRERPVQHRLDFQESRFYRAALPKRPVLVTVSVVPASGSVAPAVWGSTSRDKPSAKDSEFQDKAGKIVYKHVPLISEEASGGAGGAGHGAGGLGHHDVHAPDDLYLTVEASEGSSSYTITVGMAAISVKKADGHKVKGLAARLAALQDQGAREMFEERLREYHAERLRKLEGQPNILQRNAAALEEATHAARLKQLELRALKEMERQDSNSQRRLDQAAEMAQRRVAWTSKHEDKRRERAIEDAERERVETLEKKQRELLTRFAVLCFSASLSSRFVAHRETAEYNRKLLFSVRVIQSFLIRSMSNRRRQGLYRRAIRLRVALQTYARSMRLAVAHSAQPIAIHFLSHNSFHRQVPTVQNFFRSFRNHVVKVQRWYRRVRMVRRAYMTLLMPHWSRIVSEKVESLRNEAELAELERIALRNSMLQEIRRPGSPGKLHDSPSAPELHAQPPTPHAGAGAGAGGGSHGSKDGAVHRTASTGNSSAGGGGAVVRTGTQRKAAEKEVNDILPEFVSKLAIYDYVVRMIRERPARIEKWLKEKEQSDFQKDLEAFGVGDHESGSQPVRGKPAPVYIDDDEIGKVVCSAIKDVKCGKYKAAKANRLRLMKMAFKLFRSCRAAPKPSSRSVKGKSQKAAPAASPD